MNRTRTGTLRVFLLNRGDCAGNKFRTGSKAAAAIGVPANWLYQSANLGVFRRFVDDEIANFGFIVQFSEYAQSMDTLRTGIFNRNSFAVQRFLGRRFPVFGHVNGRGSRVLDLIRGSRFLDLTVTSSRLRRKYKTKPTIATKIYSDICSSLVRAPTLASSDANVWVLSEFLN